MLAFRLAPIPDETVFSIVARHGAILGRRDARDLSTLFFGLEADVVSIDQPRGLEHAASVMGFASGGELLAGHTAHHHDTAFASVRRRGAEESWALRGEGRIRGPAGVMGTILRPRSVLAFCDRCTSRPVDGGVHPWLRAHQLPGAFVCNVHGDPLRVTSIARTGRRGAAAYAALDDETVRSAPPAPFIPAGDRRVLLRYARAGARLLRPAPWPDLEMLQSRLLDMLGEYRWERAGSLMAMHRLVPAMKRHPNVAPLLRAIGAELPDDGWATALNGVLYRAGIGKNPLFVLMLLEVAGAGLDYLLSSTTAPAPERRGTTRPARPVSVDLCANPACPACPAVRPPAEIAALATSGRRPMAKCSRCGFAVTMADRECSRPILARACPSWDASVAEALLDPGTSLRAVSRRFGASKTALMRAARRAGAWREEWRDRADLRERAAARPAMLLAKHRAAWTAHASSALAGTPIKMTPRPAFNAYRWLMRNDRAWLDANRGDARGGCGAARRPSL